MSKKLNELQRDVCAWADSVFGANRTPHGCIAHLIKEVEELRASPYDAEEYADCLMLLLNAANQAGMSGDALIIATRNKLETNKLRRWGPVDENGISEHIRKNQG